MTIENPVSSDWEQRLVCLECRTRRWQMATALLAVTLGVVILSGSVWKDEPRLEARELRLVDENGHARLLLTLADNGHPKILMLDADGLIRAQYTSELLAFEDRGTPRVRLGFGNGLQLFDRHGLCQADLSVGTGSFLTLYNRPERGFARLGINAQGEKFATTSTSATTTPVKSP